MYLGLHYILFIEIEQIEGAFRE